MEVSFLELLYHSPLAREATVWYPSPEGKTASVANTSLHDFISYFLFFLLFRRINLLPVGVTERTKKKIEIFFRGGRVVNSRHNGTCRDTCRPYGITDDNRFLSYQ